MRNILDSIPSFILNKYTITLVGGLVWMLFFDNNDIITQVSTQQELQSFLNEIHKLDNEIEKANEQFHYLSSDQKNLERFARETYLMRKDNEDIFVFIEE